MSSAAFTCVKGSTIQFNSVSRIAFNEKNYGFSNKIFREVISLTIVSLSLFNHNISLQHSRETTHPINFKHHFCVGLSAFILNTAVVY